METNNIRRVQKMTSKGQITLPSAWRAAVGTEHVIVRTKGSLLTVAPARFEVDEDDGNWITIFDKDRDNGGTSIPAEEFVRILQKHQNEDEKVRKVAAKAKRKK